MFTVKIVLFRILVRRCQKYIYGVNISTPPPCTTSAKQYQTFSATEEESNHITYQKPPKRLETYLRDTVFVVNGKAYETLEKAEKSNNVGQIYKHINSDMDQPVYIPVYKRTM